MERHSPERPYRTPAPRKQVLLLTCMDPRLLDDVVAFMNSYNLANRYDHVVFAGAALGVMELGSPGPRRHAPSPWKQVFFDHLELAVELHKIKDVFILEHRHCGAYEHFHPEHSEEYRDTKADQDLEEKHHREQALRLAGEIRAYCARRQEEEAQRQAGKDKPAKGSDKVEAWKIKVWSFLMDLHGHVTPLRDPANETETGATREQPAPEEAAARVTESV